MEFVARHWYIVVGIAGIAAWMVLFLNRHRIESLWIRAFLGLSLEDPVLKAAMQGRKDFTNREFFGWAIVILLIVFLPVVYKLWR